MTGAYRSGMELLAATLVAAIVFVSGAWGAMALWYHGPRLMLGAYLAAAVACIGAIVLFGHAWPLVPGGWCSSCSWVVVAHCPHRMTAIGADDVAVRFTGRIDGNIVQLANVRDFRWSSEESYQVRWTDPSYDLSSLQRADAVVSYWGLRSIAHANGVLRLRRWPAPGFSVEIRKKRGQAFSAIGGFFKQYEMILIAATEPDIIGVRTNIRMEDTYLLPLNAQADTLRSLFAAYVSRGQPPGGAAAVVQHHHLQLHQRWSTAWRAASTPACRWISACWRRATCPSTCTTPARWMLPMAWTSFASAQRSANGPVRQA